MSCFDGDREVEKALQLVATANVTDFWPVMGLLTIEPSVARKWACCGDGGKKRSGCGFARVQGWNFQPDVVSVVRGGGQRNPEGK